MEESQKYIIQKLLPHLIEMTNCSPLLLSLLKAKEVISSADEAALGACHNLHEKNKTFYDMLLTRRNGYTHLKASLQNTNQSGVLALLQTSELGFVHKEVYNPDKSVYHETSKNVKRLLEQPHDTRKPRKMFQWSEPFTFKVRPPTDYFTGRSDELGVLHNKLKSSSNRVHAIKILISGLGGIGKSELVRQFIKEIIQDKTTTFRYIIWIQAETDAKLANDFKTLAADKLGIRTLNVNGCEKSVVSIVDDVYCQLKLHHSLIIFDNAENASFLSMYLPTSFSETQNIYTIITSQDNNWNADSSILLTDMTLPDAVGFIKHRLHDSVDDPNETHHRINELAIQLQCFPLALDQAVAYIQERKHFFTHYGPKDYLAELNNRKYLLSNDTSPVLPSQYERTTKDTILLTLSKVMNNYKEQSVNTLLNIMAYLNPDDIPESIFDGMFESSAKFENCLLLLKRFSLISFSTRKPGRVTKIFIHRLVQDVLRQFAESNNTEIGLLKTATEIFQKNINPDTVDNAMIFWSYAAKHIELLKTFYHFPILITSQLINMSKINDAQNFATEQLRLLQSIISYDDNAEILFYFESLMGNMMLQKSKYKECEKFLKALLHKALDFLSGSNTTILQICLDIGQSLFYLGKYTEALAKYQQVVKNSENGSIYIMNALFQTGIVLQSLREDKKAQQVFENVIKLTQSTNLELELEATCFLAITLGNSGNPLEAVKILEDVLCRANTSELKNHRLTTTITMSLAVFKYWTGQFEAALKICREIHPTCRDLFGLNNHITVQVQANIAANLHELGNKKEALRLARTVYKSYAENYGCSYYDTINALVRIGKILFDMGKPTESFFLLSKALESTEYTITASPLEIISVKFYFAQCLLSINKTTKGKSILSALQNEVNKFDSGTFFVKNQIITLCKKFL